jgi:serine/threonine protein phosphatase 1
MWRRFSRKSKAKYASVPASTRVYAVGDVHGRSDLLHQVLSQIDQHRKAYPIHQAVEVMLGDYIDRGPEAREVLDLLIDRRRRYGTICLLGNHETYLLDFLRDPPSLEDWQRYGGLETLLSYGLKPSLKPDPREQIELADALHHQLPRSHHEFLKSLPLHFTCGDYFFVHAGVRPGVALSDQRVEDLLLIRDEFLDHKRMFEKIIVHGHTPVAEPQVRRNRINLDTGAFASGRLTCMALEADTLQFLAPG